MQQASKIFPRRAQLSFHVSGQRWTHGCSAILSPVFENWNEKQRSERKNKANFALFHLAFFSSQDIAQFELAFLLLQSGRLELATEEICKLAQQNLSKPLYSYFAGASLFAGGLTCHLGSFSPLFLRVRLGRCILSYHSKARASEGCRCVSRGRKG